MLYHYTTIDKLALILKNKTLRFRNLKLVDDQDEGNTLDKGHFKDFVFVSSWTKSEIENIALWQMYAGGMNGVRIGIDPGKVKFIAKNEIDSNKTSRVIKNYKGSNPDAIAFKYSDNIVDVIYDDELYLFQERQSDHLTKLNIKNIYLYKKIFWEFQKETRFVLLACSKRNMEKHHRMINRLDSLIISLIKKEHFNCQYIYLKLDEDVFEEMEILLGPKYSGTTSDELIVDALIKEHIKKYKNTIKVSSLNIKRKS